MSTPAVLIIPGSLRQGSHSAAIAAGLVAAACGRAQFRVLRLDAVPLYNADLDGEHKPEGVAVLKQAIQEADGLVLVSPEYNYGMPGVLKNALDWASRPAYKSVLLDKPVLIITSSAGLTGGVRAQAQLRQTLSGTLSRIVAAPEVLISQAGSKIQDGRLTDPATLSFVLEAFQRLLDEIARGH
jgi:chromate reductase, NAD(P)H dehydrogenase (quinone)